MRISKYSFILALTMSLFGISVSTISADIYLKNSATENALWSESGNWTGTTENQTVIIGTTNAEGGVTQSARINSTDTITYLTLGKEANTSGRLTVEEGANLTVSSNLIVGALGTGTLKQTGGNIKTETNFYVADSGTDTSTVEFTGGTFTAVGGDGKNKFVVGNGNATMSISGTADVKLGGLDVVNGGSGTGTINVSGGKLTFQSANLRLGNNSGGHGILNISGGEVVGNSPLYTGDASGSRATVNITGGTLTANLTYCLATRGTSELNISGDGKFYAKNTFYVGHQNGTKGIINQSGGYAEYSKGIDIGWNNGNTIARFNITGGEMVATTIFRNNGNQKLDALMKVSGTANVQVSGDVGIPVLMTGGTFETASISDALTIYDGNLRGKLNADGTRTLTVKNGGSITFENDYGNIALGRPASQVSTYGNAYIAERAVDGVTSSDTFSHTQAQSGTDQWWQVELDAPMSISYVKLYNRYGSGGRLVAEGYGYHFELYDGTLDNVGNLVWKSDMLMEYDSGVKIDLNTEKAGTVLRLVRDFKPDTTISGDNLTLNLAELEVYTDLLANPELQFNVFSNGTHDQIVLEEGATLNLDNSVLKLNFEEGMDFVAGMEWDIFDVQEGATLTGEVVDIVASNFDTDIWNLAMLSNGTISLSYTPNVVPEPSSIAMLILAVISLGFLRKRRA